jgi:hypothetical protein
VNTNYRVITRDGCSTLARTLAFIFRTHSATKAGPRNGLSIRRLPGRIATRLLGPAASGRFSAPWQPRVTEASTKLSRAVLMKMGDHGSARVVAARGSGPNERSERLTAHREVRSRQAVAGASAVMLADRRRRQCG